MNKPRSSVIIHFISRYKLYFSVVILLTLVGSVLESLSIGAFLPIFMSLTGQSEEQMGGILGFITGLVTVLPFKEPIISASVFLIGIILLKTAVTLAREGFIAFSGAKVLYDIKLQTMNRFSKAEYQFFLDHNQGTLIYNSLAAPASVSGLLMIGAQQLNHLLKVAAISIILGIIFPIAALALGAIGLAYYGLMHLLSRRVSYMLGKE